MGYNQWEPCPRQILIYRCSDGRKPFEEWFSSLRDGTVKTRIRTRLDRVEDGDWGARRWVGGGVWEIKFHEGPGYRVYLGLDGIKVVVLLCGGDKRRQRDDILKAQIYWSDYLDRKG